MILNLYNIMREKQKEANAEYKLKVKEAVEGKYFKSGSVYMHIRKVKEEEHGWTDSSVVFDIFRIDVKRFEISNGRANFGHYMDETYEEITKEDFDKGIDKLADNLKKTPHK